MKTVFILFSIFALVFGQAEFCKQIQEPCEQKACALACGDCLQDCLILETFPSTYSCSNPSQSFSVYDVCPDYVIDMMPPLTGDEDSADEPSEHHNHNDNEGHDHHHNHSNDVNEPSHNNHSGDEHHDSHHQDSHHQDSHHHDSHQHSNDEDNMLWIDSASTITTSLFLVSVLGLLL